MKDRTIQAYSAFIIKYRWWVILITLAAVFAAASGGRLLTFDTDYRVFFSEENPELIAFEAMQNTYNKEDNILIALTPDNGDVFTRANLAAVEWLTKEAWQTPYSNRVDSIANYQHTYAEEDDLIVEDLVYRADTLSDDAIKRIKDIAINEPRLLNSLVNSDGSITGVNIINQFSMQTQTETPEVVEFVRNLAQQFQQKYPQFEVHISGITMLNHAFTEASTMDIQTLIPIMYIFIFVLLLFLLKSVSSLIGVVFVIAFSILSAMGMAGWFGIALTPPSANAPTTIMTLAVADSVHFLISMLVLMRRGMAKNEAITESLRINFTPIFLTSLTTIIGFLAMNGSDAPPFRDMGNIIAMGVGFAFVWTMFFMPAFIAVMPVKVKVKQAGDSPELMERFADFVIGRKRSFFWGGLLVLVLLIAAIPRIIINDNFVEYFDKSVPFRADSDYIIDNLTGIGFVYYSIGYGSAQSINNPQFLQKIALFQDWLYQQDEVVHVNSISDTLKRLNKNMHADDASFYKVPEAQDLAAQYLLLYEMSLPYGLDLNNQINVDKSATKIAVTLKNLSTTEVLDFNERAEQWLMDNTPEVMHAKGISPNIMFSHITMRNIDSMISNSIVALLLVSLILIFALKSLRFGIISLVPNLTPALASLGIWALTFTELGMAASIVFAISIGIVVDDTVHFLSKYLRARREKNLNSEDAIRYAFTTVGQALWVTTVVLVAGFALLSQSSFLINQQTGIFMAITLVMALVLDFLFLPALLLKVDKGDVKKTNNAVNNMPNDAKASDV